MNDQNNLSASLCTYCSGNGQIYGKDCKECLGSGYVAKDGIGNEYFVKVDGENLIISGVKKTNNPTSQTSSQAEHKNDTKQGPIIKEDSNAVKLIGNILFGIVLLPIIMVTILYFRNNYIIYAIILLIIFFWGLFNIIYLPENVIFPLKKQFISTEDPKDLHWAIEEIKKYTDGT